MEEVAFWKALQMDKMVLLNLVKQMTPADFIQNSIMVKLSEGIFSAGGEAERSFIQLLRKKPSIMKGDFGVIIMI